jgi:UDP-glucose 4-epimerase
MKILVTGGAGFIGSWVAERYLQRGHEVVVVDNLSTGKKEFVPDGAEFYPVDIRDKKSMEDLFREKKFDIVNHHAAQSSVAVSVKDPFEDFTNNVYGSMILLEMAKEYGVSKFIFASTGGAIYGEPEKNPVSEEHKLEPVSPYAFSKMVFERYLDYYHDVFGISFIALRYGNVYGPRQSPFGEAGVIAIFSYRMLKEEECYIYGDGDQERDFVYVEDVAEANVKALELLFNSDNLCFKFNIGTGKGISVNSIFKILAKRIGYDRKPVYMPRREGEVYKIYLDSKKAGEVLNWKPVITFEQGVDKVVEWFKNEGSEKT